jgi:hypothetical protein
LLLFFPPRYKGFNIGETTPPPENFRESPPRGPEKDDGFPKVFNMTSNMFTKGGIHTSGYSFFKSSAMAEKFSDKFS